MSGPKEPFGYVFNPLTSVREPIESELKALKQAKFYIAQGCSMQSARDWLVKKTGREISVQGLLKAIKYTPEIRHGKTTKDST